MAIIKRYRGLDVPEDAKYFHISNFYQVGRKGVYFKFPDGVDSWEVSMCYNNLTELLEDGAVELPQESEQYLPVGEWCEYDNQNTGAWIKIFYLGRDSRGIHAIQYESGLIEAYCACTFRPIKTEREKVIEWAYTIWNKGYDSESEEDALGRMFDLGALKIPDGE